ncbi:MAG: CoA-binding protein [Candidatus Aenigmarchaeota archaeon]|nr:CoA-binding protein [Candidatus Aenigmarchaeota archaeon]MDW8160092.1 CoA-binding protein [Candidatus Aenigmarchaeota archaeon]
MMEKFFYPRSVAIIGASQKEGKIGFSLVKNLKEKFRGKIYPINPNADSILGLKVYPSVLEVEDEIDLCIIAVKSNIVPNVLEECGKKGVKNVVIISAGFSEAGEEGKVLEREIKKIAERYRIRIVGPNTIGVFNPEIGLDATFFLDQDVNKPGEGNVSFFSQSGTVAVLAMESFSESNIGISKLISYGNACDINESDIIQYFLKDEKTKVIAGFIEGIRDGKKFLEAVRNARKPIILLKGGKTKSGSRAVSSHTSSLAGDYFVFSNVLRQFKVREAKTWEELVDSVKIFSFMEKVNGDRVCVVTNGGGFGVLASDEAEKNELKLPEPSEELKKDLEKILPPFASLKNPIDIIADATPERYKQVFEVLEKHDEYDVYLVVVLTQTPMINEGIVEAILSFKKPKVVCMSGKKSIEMIKELEKRKVPVFHSPERAVKAIKILLS